MKKLIFIILVAFSSNIVNAQWVPTNGPFGGVITCSATDGANIFVGTIHGGVFLSTDNGSSWTQVNSGLTNLDITAMAIDGNKIFLGTRNGAFLSTNNGTIWIAVNTGLSYLSITSFCISGNNILATADRSDAFLFVDTTNSWVSISKGPPLLSPNIVSLAIIGNKIFGEDEYHQQLYLSEDNGNSWTAVNNGVPYSTILDALAINGNTIFAAFHFDGLFLSTDAGNSWTKLSDTLINQPISSLAFSGNKIFAGTASGGIVVSDNNGSAWRSVSSGLPLVNQIQKNYCPITTICVNGNTIFAGTTGGGLFSSNNNGNSWTASSGLVATVINSLVANGNNIFAIADNQASFLSSDTGSTWSTANNGLPPDYLNSLVFTGNDVFTTTKDSGLFLNNGSSWSPVKSNSTYGYITVLAANGNKIFGNSWTTLYSSSDNGISWDTVLNIAGAGQRTLSSLTAAGSCVLIQINWNDCSGGSGTDWFFSQDNGITWNGHIPNCKNFNGYGVIPPSMVASGSNVFLSDRSQGLFLSTNNGSSWTTLTNGLPAQFSPLLFALDTNIFAADNNHLFLSSNNGNTWTDISKGLPFPTAINAFAVSDNNIFAGADGAGIRKRPLCEFLPGFESKDCDRSINSQTNFKVYPNPATNQLYIETGAQTLESIKIFNSVGSLIIETKQLLNNSIDISVLPKGVYVAVVNMNSTSVKQKWVKM